MKQVYIAGPDVFFPDAAAHFDRLCESCAALGVRGVRPSDGGLSTGVALTGGDIAERIFRANLELIRSCDALLANLTPFRNALDPDSGTVFELGFAVALGKPVAAYFPGSERAYEDRIEAHCGCTRDLQGHAWDARDGCLIESFGEPANLMLSRSTPIFATFDAALRNLVDRFSAAASVR
jgi:nucleoside 2-deoxyribosyltransferase